MAQHDLGGECSRAHSGFALGGVSGLRAVASGTSSGSTASVLSTSVKRFADPVDFFEALNLFIMFCTALGLCTAVAVTEFLEHTVFDTIRMRGKTWQVAHELFLVMLRRIEDSGGKLNLVNCINDTYLNTVLEEAEVSAKRHGSFRPTPG